MKARHYGIAVAALLLLLLLWRSAHSGALTRSPLDEAVDAVYDARTQRAYGDDTWPMLSEAERQGGLRACAAWQRADERQRVERALATIR